MTIKLTDFNKGNNPVYKTRNQRIKTNRITSKYKGVPEAFKKVRGNNQEWRRYLSREFDRQMTNDMMTILKTHKRDGQGYNVEELLTTEKVYFDERKPLERLLNTECIRKIVVDNGFLAKNNPASMKTSYYYL